MAYKKFETFQTPNLTNIECVTPMFVLGTSDDTNKSLTYVIHTEPDLLALGVDLESGQDPFYIDEKLKEDSSQCDICKKRRECEYINMAALSSEKYSPESLKDLHIASERVKFSDLKSYRICEFCYKPLVGELSEWLENNNAEISSCII